MADTPSANFRFTAVADGVDSFPDPAPVEIPAGMDQCGAQVKVSVISGGTIQITLEINMAPDGTPAAQEPPWEAVINGQSTAIASDTGETLGSSDGGTEQLIEIGHARRLRMTAAGAGGVQVGDRVDCYLSSIGTALPPQS